MITRKTLDKIIQMARKENPWSLSNDILYAMCKKHPSNTEAQSVLAKTLIIGRVYSAALERGIGEKKTKGGEFYIKNVLPKISGFFTDKTNKELLEKLKVSTNAILAIEIHGKLVESLRGLRNSNKVSFASKYLHFHYPRNFYIYDSRAKKAIRILNYHLNSAKKLTKKNKIEATESANKDYEAFVSKCEILRKKLSDEVGDLSIREFDTILIKIADSKK